jgi:hypothetical protein
LGLCNQIGNMASSKSLCLWSRFESQKVDWKRKQGSGTILPFGVHINNRNLIAPRNLIIILLKDEVTFITTQQKNYKDSNKTWSPNI